MRQERVRIIDIAEELGLSTATVSNLIHGNYICMDRERIDGFRAGMEGKQADFLEIPQKKEERDIFYIQNFSKILQYTAVFAVSDFMRQNWFINYKNKG